MQQMQGMGGINSLLEKIPGLGATPSALQEQQVDKEVGRLIAIINSMTPGERRFPDIIKGSRKRRIAVGSGTQIQDVNRLLKQFTHARKMMKKMQTMKKGKKGGMPKLPFMGG